MLPVLKPQISQTAAGKSADCLFRRDFIHEIHENSGVRSGFVNKTATPDPPYRSKGPNEPAAAGPIYQTDDLGKGERGACWGLLLAEWGDLTYNLKKNVSVLTGRTVVALTSAIGCQIMNVLLISANTETINMPCLLYTSDAADE